MVAMLMVSLAVVLGLRALQIGHASAVQAQEWLRIEILAKSVLADGPRGFQPAAGAAGGLTWTLKTETTGAERPIALCRRVVTVEDDESSRQFTLSAIESCPPVEAS